MPAYVFTAPDGKTYTVNAPDGVSEGEAFQMLSQQLGQQQGVPDPAAPDPDWQAGLPAAPGATGGPSGPGAGLPPGPPPDPAAEGRREVVEGMPWYEKLGAGAGQSVDSNIRGVRQLFNYLTNDQEDLDMLAQEEQQAREFNEPLLDSGWGRTGQIGGHILQMLLPAGAAAKGVKAVTAGLPRAAQVSSVLGTEAALGGAYGAMQPTVEGESHGDNAAIGAAFGVGSRLAPWAVGAGARAVGEKSGISPVLRIAANSLRGAGKDSAGLGSPAVREAAGQRIGQITEGVRVPLKPLASELGAVERAYGSSLPRSVRDQLRALDDWGKRYGDTASLKGERVREMQTALYREGAKREGAAQSGLERAARALNKAVEDELTPMQARALRQALREYRTGVGQPGIDAKFPMTTGAGTGLFLSPGPE